jgi:hypothetical protein
MIADRIMNWIWGRGNWDKNSPAYRFWKRQVKRRKRSLKWWNQNCDRLSKKYDN